MAAGTEHLWTLPVEDEVLVFAVLLLVLLVAPLVSRWARLPAIVGLIAAGIALGPHAGGVLVAEGPIGLLGIVGLQYIMFLAGLEIDLEEFAKARLASIGFGFLTFLLPGGACLLVAHYGLGLPWASAALWASMCAAHTLLAYPIVSRLGLGKRPAVTIAVGGTVLADVGALLVLALVAGAVKGHLSPLFVLLLGLRILVYGLTVLVVLPRFGRWFFRRVAVDAGEQFVFVLAAVFVCAVLAHLAGLEPIVGAFLAGLGLNRLIPEQSSLANRLHFVGQHLFVPCFLLWVGMLVDLGALAQTPAAWAVAGAILVPAVAGKGAAAALSAWWLGWSRDEGWVVFGLSVARAAATLAVALVGHEQLLLADGTALIGDDALNAAVLLILVTCILAPWLTEIAGRRLARAQELVHTPARRRQRLLVPLANPATAEAITDLALLLRRKEEAEPLFPIIVVGDDEQVDQRVAVGEAMLSSAVIHAAAAEVPVQPLIRVDVNPAAGIARAAKELRITSVLVGWRAAQGAGERVLGGILDQVLAGCPARILAARLVHPLATTRRVLLALPPFVAHEPGFDETVGLVKDLAKQLGAELVLRGIDDQDEHEGAEIARTVRELKPATVKVTVEPSRSWARTRADLLACDLGPDLLVVVSARSGTAAWQPGLDRLPRLLAERRPDLNLVLCYPPLPGRQGESDGELPSPLPARGTAIRGVVVAGDGWLEAVRELVEPLGGVPTAIRDHIAEGLAEGAREFATRLAPGAVLLHSHTPLVPGPCLHVGTHAGGLAFPRIEEPVRVVVVLLSPAGTEPQEHLRRLAAIAALVRAEEALERLLAAGDDASVARVVGELAASATAGAL